MIPNDGGLVVERLDGRGEWSQVAHLRPRSTFTDSYFEDNEIGRVGTQMTLRIRWLDYHALDYVAFVSKADRSTWSASIVAADSAEIAYGGLRLAEISLVDRSFAVLNPGSKLTVTFPYRDEQEGRKRSVVFGTHGYYVTPRQGREVSVEGSEPLISYLDRNHPNPFNPITRIVFGLSSGAEVSFGIYSVRGELIRRLYNGPLESGDHAFVWDGRNADGKGVASGVYFYELRAGSELAKGKMIAVK